MKELEELIENGKRIKLLTSQEEGRVLGVSPFDGIIQEWDTVIKDEHYLTWFQEVIMFLDEYCKNVTMVNKFKALEPKRGHYISVENFNKGLSILEAIRNSNITKPSIPKSELTNLDMSKVFIVHGHDDLMKMEVSNFLVKLGIDAIILHEQANGGKTIIEKIEDNTHVGFGIVLYSPCDEGKKKGDTDLKARARQNVVFEHGYLIGKLGRDKVCALNKSEVEVPGDISGIVYISFKDNWKIDIAKELRNAGYAIDMNGVI